jgi:hypothetical protein
MEIKFLTAIMGRSKRNRIRNAHIREELWILDIRNQIEGNRLKWFGHFERSDKQRIPKI